MWAVIIRNARPSCPDGAAYLGMIDERVDPFALAQFETEQAARDAAAINILARAYGAVIVDLEDWEVV